MPGRHRKPGSTTRRIARTGAFAVIAGAPMLVTGTAMAAPVAGHVPEKRADHDDEDYSDPFGDREDSSADDEDREEAAQDAAEDAADEAADAQEAAHTEADTKKAHRDKPETVVGAARRYSPTGGGPSSSSDQHWDRLAECESKQDWNADTGNGYHGGLQFSDSTWQSYGGRSYAPTADRASREEQIAVARKVQRDQGWTAWPSCSRQLGYT